jgi:nucleoside-diphosphate-sugar epimerase
VKALVTGSAGFLGRHFAAALRHRGYLVIEVDVRHGIDAGQIFAERLFVGGRWDLIVHCAAVEPHRAAIDGRAMHMAQNLALDSAMFDWAVRTGQGRVLYVSSCAAYPTSLQHLGGDPLAEDSCGTDPFDGYGWLKLTGERMAAEATKVGVPVHVVRPFSGYGEDQSPNFPFRAIVDRARAGADPFPIWGSADQVRDWIHVSDVVAGSLALVEQDVREPVNLCTGRATTMRELAEIAWVGTGRNGRPNIQVDETAPMGVMYRVGDPTRMLKHYTPTVTLEEGVRRALAA